LYLEGKYVEAVKTLQKVVDQFGQSQSAQDALSSLAASYLRLKKLTTQSQPTRPSSVDF
jgi:outer membrane protein assembly factor BamD (BamD/ComL family)